MRTTAERRHNDWTKAIRKHNLYPDYYDNLHQYSKNKIHCSCPLCRAKSNDRNAKYGSKINWSVSDKRRFDEMEYEIQELDTTE